MVYNGNPIKIDDLGVSLFLETPISLFLLLMERIPPAPVEVGSLSHYLQAFVHSRWSFWDFWTITVWHHVFKFNIWHPSPPSEGLRCILPLPRMPRNRGKIDPSNSRNATIDAYLSRKNSILELQILNELHTVALSFHSAWDSDRCLLQKWFLEKGMVLDYPFFEPNVSEHVSKLKNKTTG